MNDKTPPQTAIAGRSPRRLSLKRTLGISLLISLIGFPARAEWRNSLKPAGNPCGQLVLVNDGKPMSGIVCPDNATPQDRAAATELQKWIREITGVTLDINYGGARGNLILMRTDPALGDGGYTITNLYSHIRLTGGTHRGMMNAVYALLEEDMGCRFYTPDSIRIPRTNTLVISPVGRRYTPQLRLRDPFYHCAFDADWSLRNRTSAPHAAVPEVSGGHMDYANMFVHTAEQLVPPDKYFAKYSDYFAQLTNGTRTARQLCPTHPEVAAIAIDYVRQVLQKNPDTELISISKNDNTTVCHCERCSKLRTEEGSDMANQLVLVNRVAEAIESDYPKVTIDTLAYLETIRVPKTIRPRKNVAIRLCNDNVGAWRQPFTPAAQCDVARLVKAWSEVHNRIYIWDYNVNFSHYLAPMPNLDIIASNIRFWVTNHAEGVMLQGGYQGPAERDELKSWVASKLLWNPALDEKALTKDFIWGHYGKAAQPLEDYEKLLEQMRSQFATEMDKPAGGIHYHMDAPFLTREFAMRAAELFAKARALAEGDPQLIRRVDRARLPLLYLQCARGPGFTDANYGSVVKEFERIARIENVRHLAEHGQGFEEKLEHYRKQDTGPKRLRYALLAVAAAAGLGIGLFRRSRNKTAL